MARRLFGLALLLATSAMPAAAQPETRDDYETGTLQLDAVRFEDGWQAPGLNWTIADGVVTRREPGGSLWFRQFRLLRDFDLSFKLQREEGATGGLAVTDAGVVMAVGESQIGMPETCAPIAPMPGAWVSVHLRAEGGSLSMWLDDRLACTVPLKRERDGSAGMFFLRLLDGKGTLSMRSIRMTPVIPEGRYIHSPLADLETRNREAEAFAAYADRIERELPKSAVTGSGFPVPHRLAPSPLTVTKLGTDEIATYYSYTVPALEGVSASGIIAIPNGVDGPLPMIVALHGTGGSPAQAMNPAGIYHDMISGPLREGYAVLAPQLFTLNRREVPFGGNLGFAAAEAIEIKLAAHGHPAHAVDAARIVAAIDGALLRFAIDETRIGATGLSHGGYMTVYLAAVEPRVRAAVASAGFSPFVTPDFVPGPRDLLSSIAPRPLMLTAGQFDPYAFINADWAEDYLEFVQQSYGPAGDFRFVADQAGHDYSWHIASPFFAEHLATPLP